jgi:metallophosphoesterase (TIGR03768 family)
MKPSQLSWFLLTTSLTCASAQTADWTPIPPTTRQQTVRPYPIPADSPTIYPYAISNFAAFGYSKWQTGPGVDEGQRLNLMPDGYPGATNATRLLHFFAVSDIHITDKESPVQAIAYGYQGGNSSAYSPVMLYTPQVLDAAIRTVNGLHRQTPFDFGLFVGDASNGSQYNELRWYIDVIDGRRITPSSGTNAGADTIDYQKPFQAAGLNASIPWYQTLGNHDHMWLGSHPINEYFRETYTNDTILLMGDLYTEGVDSRTTFMGSIDGRTPYGDILGVGPVANFVTNGVTNAPHVLAADPSRYPLKVSEWINEFFTTTSQPAGHGFARTNAATSFASYTVEPKTNAPIKLIVLDDTQTDAHFALHMQGYLDEERFAWLTNELNQGQAEDKLMIISAHLPIALVGYGGTNSPITSTQLLAKLHEYPNLLLWVAGHRHRNAITPHMGANPAHPEDNFWEVETASLRDFPQQFRTFEILRNTDNSISILATCVDPQVKAGEPAAISRGYAVAAARIFTNPCPNWVDTNAYATNAELVKLLSPAMQKKIANYGGTLAHPVAVDRTPTGVLVSFKGKLQSADTLAGPWREVSEATTPYTVSASAGAKYYRAIE